jgi:hypothetical protein
VLQRSHDFTDLLIRKDLSYAEQRHEREQVAIAITRALGHLFCTAVLQNFDVPEQVLTSKLLRPAVKFVFCPGFSRAGNFFATPRGSHDDP